MATRVHPAIARFEEERNLLGQMLSVTAYDATGEKCVRIECDPATGAETWRNVRDDLARTGGLEGPWPGA